MNNFFCKKKNSYETSIKEGRDDDDSRGGGKGKGGFKLRLRRQKEYHKGCGMVRHRKVISNEIMDEGGIHKNKPGVKKVEE
jgi:hypothetical protein